MDDIKFPKHTKEHKHLRDFALSSLTIALFASAFIFTINSVASHEVLGNTSESTQEKDTSEKNSYIKKPSSRNILPFYEVRRNALLNSGERFLEVHLENMETRVYEDGELLESFPVLAKGDPQGWGGSAVGQYNITGTNPLGYSRISDVYMPYTLAYYGKYLIHGEPHYPGGQKLMSEVSGGCIRQTDEHASEIFDMVEYGDPILVIDKPSDDHIYKSRSLPLPEITTESYLIADLDSGQILAERDSKRIRPIASVTKFMTATVVAENVDLRNCVIPSEESLNSPYGYIGGLIEGTCYRPVELFYPMLIASSNSAAEAATQFMGREWTIDDMNRKAQSIMMDNTVFRDPSGLDDRNVSTARDLFYLTRYIYNNRPPLFEISKGNDVNSFGPVRFDVKNMRNRNIFHENDTFIGGKSGFINASGYTGTYSFSIKDGNGSERNIAIIMLGGKGLASIEDDAKELLEWTKRNYF